MSIGPDSASAGLGTKVAAGAAGLVLLVAVLAAGAGAGIASLLGGATTPSSTATGQIPATMLLLYQEAATTCPGLPWTVLAAIGTVESDNGQSTLPGVKSGANGAGAMGPLQMLGPTFAAYDQPVPPGGANPPSPYDPTDAVYAAARDLCCQRGGQRRNLSASVFAYNHSQSYVAEVLALASSYSQTQAQTVAAGTAGGSLSTGPSLKSALHTFGAARPPASASTAPGWSRPPTRWP
ncbi:NLP/P60 protein, partial [mine drainage metagenome]